MHRVDGVECRLLEEEEQGGLRQHFAVYQIRGLNARCREIFR